MVTNQIPKILLTKLTAVGYLIHFLVHIKARLLSSAASQHLLGSGTHEVEQLPVVVHIALKIAMIFRYFDACAFSDSEVFHLSSSQDSYFCFKIAVVFSSTLLPHLHIYAMPNHNAKFSTQPVHKNVMFQVDNDDFPYGFRYLLPSKYLTDYCRKIQAIHISVCILYASQPYTRHKESLYPILSRNSFLQKLEFNDL